MEHVFKLATPLTMTVNVYDCVPPPLLGEPLSVTDSAPSVPEQFTVAFPFVVVAVGLEPVATSDVYSVAVVFKLLPVVLPAIV